ncbi:MAG: regulatory iron-sulfur-containing complex subunit RicT [Patescibacteria group bacterium]|jgi:cell fate regulator YaaT (PSP1 superfamily)
MIKKAIGVQLNPWDRVTHFDGEGLQVRVGDRVIVKSDAGLEIGRAVTVMEHDEHYFTEPLRPIVRVATTDDLARVKHEESRKAEILSVARASVLQYQLEMKLVDCYFSFDGGRVTFVFTAEGRIDFRELVKDLAKKFQKSIRLQQVGIRDEAKRMGGFGPCGRELCCTKFLNNMTSVTTEYARLQQVHSRGSDRISGGCGRLMCCLSYEKDFYESELKHFPAVDSTVKTKQGTGRVTGTNVIKQTVTVLIDNTIVEVPIKDVKKV